MKVELELEKSAGENADDYFKRAKKLGAKAEAAKAAITESERKIAELEAKAAEPQSVEETTLKDRKWYEKFRWFTSSAGRIIIGGRDATTNEILIKKHAKPDDLVFHADVTGSPFFLAPADASPQEILETAIATASYSRAWKFGVGELEVYYVKASQLTKAAKAGEYISKGSFMIYGERKFIKAPMEVAVGFSEEVLGGPASAIAAQTKNFVTIHPGRMKPSDAAKFIRSKLGIKESLDEIIRFFPPGECDITGH